MIIMRIIIIMIKIRAYGSKICNNKFTWCFHKAKLVLYAPCKDIKNLLFYSVFINLEKLRIHPPLTITPEPYLFTLNIALSLSSRCCKVSLGSSLAD